MHYISLQNFSLQPMLNFKPKVNIKNKISNQVPPGHYGKLLSRNLLECSLFFMFLSDLLVKGNLYSLVSAFVSLCLEQKLQTWFLK